MDTPKAIQAGPIPEIRRVQEEVAIDDVRVMVEDVLAAPVTRCVMAGRT
jgi:hypothetical protein